MNALSKLAKPPSSSQAPAGAQGHSTAIDQRAEAAAAGLRAGIDLGAVAILSNLAKSLMGSKLLPSHIRSEGDALVIMLSGFELGIPPMKALRSIHLIEGKPELSADMMLGLCKRSGYKVRWLESTERTATLQLVDPRDPEYPHTETYSMKMAADAGLATKQNWRKFPVAMLKARCVSAAVRAFAPEILSTTYVEGELSGDEPNLHADDAPRLPLEKEVAYSIAENTAAMSLNKALEAGDGARIEKAREHYQNVVEARSEAQQALSEDDDVEAEKAILARWRTELGRPLTEEELFAWLEENGGVMAHMVFYRDAAWALIKGATLEVNKTEGRTRGKDWITFERVRDFIKGVEPVAPAQTEEEETDVSLNDFRDD